MCSSDLHRPVHYRLEASRDGTRWTVLSNVVGEGAVDWVAFPVTEARYWRLTPGAGEAGTLVAFAPQAADFADNPTTRLNAIAHERPRGEYPRGMREQTAWTLVGGPSHRNESGLLSEDGAYEWGVGAPSVEPFLVIDGRRQSWAEAVTEVSLKDGDLPLPTVTRRYGPLALSVSAMAPFESDRKSTRLNSSHT